MLTGGQWPRRRLALVALVLLSGCSDTQRGKEIVEREFRDPASLQWRDVRAVNYAGSDYVCGEVNGKNGFGAYVGFRPFVVHMVTGEAFLEPQVEPGDDPALTEEELGFYRVLSGPCRDTAE